MAQVGQAYEPEPLGVCPVPQLLDRPANAINGRAELRMITPDNITSGFPSERMLRRRGDALVPHHVLIMSPSPK